MYKKLKSLIENDQLFYTCLIVLVAVTSFGLGRASSVDFSTHSSAAVQISASPMIYTQEIPGNLPIQETVPSITGTVAVVASRSGTRYHLPSCPGAAQIKPENLITFTSIESAQAAGYTPAANCSGLK